MSAPIPLPDGRFLYECAAGCGHTEIAESEFGTDMPEGVFLTIRRVTEAHNHYLTGELFTCSKECALDVIQYGIHHNAETFRPIGRKQRR